MQPIIITLEYIPPAEVRGNSRAHWRKKHKASFSMRESGITSLLGRMWSSQRIKFTFAFYHDRKIDLDNLAIGMKAWVDGAAWVLKLPNDDPDHVVYGEHSFTKVPKGKSRTIVTIEEIA